MAGGGGWQFLVPPSPSSRLVLGCVSYDPSVSTIWDRMADHLRTRGDLPGFVYVLFTSYEAQVGALLEGRIDVAWNGPVAHVMAEDLALEHGRPSVRSLGMRDVDRDFPTVCLARKDAVAGGAPAPAEVGVEALSGLIVATGSTDSPQGHLVPVDWLTESEGVRPASVAPHQADLGKHGDTALGEISALESLLNGDAQAALLSDMMYQRGLEGRFDTIDPAALRDDVALLDAHPPPFDHCSFDALVGEGCSRHERDRAEAFARAVLAMDMSDPEQAETMKLEGIKERWVGPRVDPRGSVRSALHRRGFAKSSAAAAPPSSSSARAFSTSTSAGRGQTRQSVGVIGAGVAGLQTIRALRAVGFDVTAFEADDGVGGLWRDNYLSYGIQVPKQLYEFPDFPFEEAPAGEFADGKKVARYIERYSEAFDLGGSVRLKTRVVSAVPSAGGGKAWTVTTEKDGSRSVHEFDKLVVCTGMYSSSNSLLPISDEASSDSVEVMHASDFRRPEQARGKKVVVVGGAKSAIDVAVAASDAGAEAVTLLSRRPHWAAPRKVADIIPFQYIFLSRLGQNLVIGHSGPLPSCSPGYSSLLHSVGQFVMPPVFKVVELLFSAQFGNVTGPTSPFLKSGIVEDFYGYAHILDYSLRDKVKAGAIDWRIGEIKEREADGIVLADGSHVEADAVVFGTGFKKDYSVFPDETRKALNVETDGLYLFNHTIPPAVPNLAFVGSELATIMNITSYGLQAAWLAKLWSGEMQNAPDRETMEKEVEAVKAWKRGWMPDTPSRASLVLLHQTHFHDRLMKDLGIEHRRKFPNVLAEYVLPYQSQDYDGVISSLGEEGTGFNDHSQVVSGSS